MRIVIDARRLHRSTGRYTRKLLEYLQELDSDNTYHVIINPDDQAVWAPSAKNFIMHVVKWEHYTFGEQFGFAKYLYSLHPDLVHFTMPQQPLLYFGKRVTTVHDLTLVNYSNTSGFAPLYHTKKLVFKIMLKIVIARSTVITPTKYTRDAVLDFKSIAKKRIHVTYESADPPTKSQKKKAVPALKNKDFLLYVGNAFPYKNIEALIDAFRQLQDKYPKLHLALVGKKEKFYSSLETKVENEAINNVHFLDFVSEDQLSWLYAHAKLYVFPSLSEGFGLPGLEAMQHDLPVASSDATCLPEVYGEAAYYFDPADIDAIGEAIHTVLKSNARQQELVKKGKALLKKYSWEKMARQTHAIYLTVMGTK